MDDEKLKAIQRILEKSSCPRQCRCYHIKPEEICRARSMGVESLLECLEDEPEKCSFSVAFGGSFFCKCQTRLELAKLLGD